MKHRADLDDQRALLARLPDDVEHVEARGLLSGPAHTELVRSEVGDAGLVFAPLHGLAVGYGRPGPDLARRLDERASASAHGLPARGIELHLDPASASAWMDAGAATHGADAILHGWDADPERLQDLVRHPVREIRASDDPAVGGLPRWLRDELGGLAAWPPVAFAFAGEQAVSVAYAFVQTEALWDVSIDTLRDFRREGFATSCAAFLIQRQLDRGKRPVWGAAKDNAASHVLAARLGFRRVAGQVILWRTPFTA